MDQEWVYSQNVQDHFMNPRHILMVSEEEYKADGVGLVGSAACGDMMKVYIKVDENQKIVDLKWKTYGCASAIASTSAMSVMVIGMSLEEAYHLTPDSIVKSLGGLPSNKVHCSVLGDKALRVAIDHYFKNKKIPNPFGKLKSKVVCDCVFKTEEDIKLEVLEGVKDFKTIAKHTKIGTVCGRCCKKAEHLVEEFAQKYYSQDIYQPEEKK